MKRRTFIAMVGVTSFGIQTGLAATGQVIFNNSPWLVFPGIAPEIIDHFDYFTKELKNELSSVNGNKTLAIKVSAPKKIVFQKSNSKEYSLLYKNINGKYIRMEKKNGQLTTAVFAELPD